MIPRSAARSLSTISSRRRERRRNAQKRSGPPSIKFRYAGDKACPRL
ncbi:MAG: hypothetical protein OJF58_002915 [Enhydrobacter sp.]|nr:MAG: hypothetical protein OJF58_002915 [Enhydrobacter sp.]